MTSNEPQIICYLLYENPSFVDVIIRSQKALDIWHKIANIIDVCSPFSSITFKDTIPDRMIEFLHPSDIFENTQLFPFKTQHFKSISNEELVSKSESVQNSIIQGHCADVSMTPPKPWHFQSGLKQSQFKQFRGSSKLRILEIEKGIFVGLCFMFFQDNSKMEQKNLSLNELTML